MSRGALRKDFFCFFLGFFFFLLLLGCMFLVFASLFCPRSFWVLFFFFFLGVFSSFFALGAGRRAVLFSPSSFGACFCLFFFHFWGVFCRFFFSKGLVLVVGPFLGLFLGSRGALRKDFFCFFFGGAFFLGACSCCGSFCFFFGLVFLGPRGALRKDFFFFFLGGLFFVVAGVHVPRFCSLFCLRSFWGFSFFLRFFLFLFCPRGGASCCSFFSLFFWGLFLFVFLLFLGGFSSFFLL